MMLRNAFRLLGTNFSLVWKNLAYKLIVILVFGGMMAGFGINIIKTLSEADFFVEFGKFWGDMVTMNTLELSRAVVDLLGSGVDIIVSNIASLSINLIGVCVAFILLCIFINMAQLTMTDVIKGHMSSLSKFGFCGAYLRNFWTSLKQSILLFIVKLPFWAVLAISGYFILNLMVVNSVWAILSPMIFVLVAIIVISIQNTVLACFSPYLSLHNAGVCESLNKGVEIVSRRFYRTWSSNIVFVLLAFVVNFVCARYTFGVALLVTLPATIVFNAIFNMVVYYESQGMRYYIDSSTIVVSKEFGDLDSVKNAKYVI